MSLNSCCTPCSETETVNVPGPEGDPGADGTNGLNGENAYTITTDDFDIPAVGAQVTIDVASSAWMVVGQKVVVTGPATFEVIATPTGTTATLEFMGYTDDLAPGVTIALGAGVSPSGTEPVLVLAGLAASGANVDITSLGGLTTPLSVAQGGTGGATSTAARTNLGVGGAPVRIICLEDQEAPTTVGGAATGTPTWDTRTLNTEVSDLGGFCALVANVFTLAAGTYRLEAKVPAYNVGSHQARLYNVTVGAVQAYGSTERSVDTHNTQTSSFIRHYFTIAVPTQFRIEHTVQTPASTSDFGSPGNLATHETYTQVWIEREAN